jgi:nucleotide-binding universal stress UspA family protein
MRTIICGVDGSPGARVARSWALASADQPEQTFAPQTSTAPVVAAVDGSAASTTALDTAVRLAAEINTPLVFVYVRRAPAGFFGAPVYQRRLTKEMARARRALDRALAVADSAGSRPRVRSSRARRGGGSPSSRAIGARGSSSSARAGASWAERVDRRATHRGTAGHRGSLHAATDGSRVADRSRTDEVETQWRRS